MGRIISDSEQNFFKIFIVLQKSEKVNYLVTV